MDVLENDANSHGGPPEIRRTAMAVYSLFWNRPVDR